MTKNVSFFYLTLLSPKQIISVFPDILKQKLPSLGIGLHAHLYDGGLADVLCCGGTIQHAIAVLSPLDVAQPARPVRVAIQVGVESDRVIAGITCTARGV